VLLKQPTPCGEQFLHGGDSCNLGSINLGNYAIKPLDAGDPAARVDWARLGETVKLAIRFLDNVIDANLYPVDEIKQMVKNNRRVGLGIMGFADLLIHMRIAYGSPAAIKLAMEIMAFMQKKAEDASEDLAIERGDFPNKHLSKWATDSRPRRNAALLSIAPTGTISMIAGCSFGCEPYFGIAYTKHVMKDAEGRPQHLYYVLPLFEEIARAEGFYSEALLARVEANRGSLKGLDEVPIVWQEVFTVAADVTVDQHIDMLAAFQKHTCNSVSKTLNAPNHDTRESVARSIMRAYRSGCKGFTYYRDGSRTEQVVTFSKDGDIATPETRSPGVKRILELARTVEPGTTAEQAQSYHDEFVSICLAHVNGDRVKANKRLDEHLSDPGLKSAKSPITWIRAMLRDESRRQEREAPAMLAVGGAEAHDDLEVVLARAKAILAE
jgi:ribonucleoside-diphosphate reductase alpha chain